MEKEVTALGDRLMRFTPEVEPSAEEPGVFWLNGIGLSLLYTSFEEWARAIHADIETRGFRGSVVVGFTRFGTYAVAKARQEKVIFEDPSQERAAVREVFLDYLDLDPDLRDTLSKLGIRTVGAFLSLPAGGLHERFGPKAYRLYRMASGDLWEPLQPCISEEPVRQNFLLDDPESDITRLLFLIKRLLRPMLVTLADRSEALAEPILRFLIYRVGWREEQIRRLLSTEDADVLFVSGTASNQGTFYRQFDHVVLLSAPRPVIVERLATRTNNPYGKHADELARVLGHIETVEPLLRRGATLEVDTSAPLDQVVETILRLVRP